MTRKLKIAVATHFFPSSSQPNRGRPVYEITKALARIADVRVFCVDSAYPRYRFLQPRSFLYRDNEPSHSMSDVKVEYLQYTALPVITRPLNGHNCGRALVGRLRQFQPDLVIGYNVYPEGFGAVAAARDLGIPAVIGALGSDILRIPGYVVGQLVAQTLRKASFVVTVSNALRERAIRFGTPPEKCRTIHNGCDFEVFRPASRAAARLELSIDLGAEVVVFVGRLVALKGLRDLMEAAAILKASRPRLRLVCIGDGPMGPELLQRSSRPDLKGLVQFVGSANPKEIARWLAASNVLCLPSHSEGCPNVVIEAISCGRPVVASSVGGIPELLNPNCGMLVPPKNARELARTLSRALDHPWNEEQIANSSRRSWDEVARETYQACCAAVGNSSLIGEVV
ncbi:MAG: glycosyltransferase [Acidobacteriia bacterium]|nr:glycosyltransferase [Terriglobia bacterium]